jgi:hypothetical protein
VNTDIPNRRATRSWPATALTLAALSPLLVLAASVIAAMAMTGHHCSGDGGVPYAAPGSSQRHFCDDVYLPLNYPWAFIPPVLAVVGVIALLVARRWRIYLALLALSLLLGLSPLLVSAVLPNQ